jgi:hypothetical protein
VPLFSAGKKIIIAGKSILDTFESKTTQNAKKIAQTGCLGPFWAHFWYCWQFFTIFFIFCRFGLIFLLIRRLLKRLVVPLFGAPLILIYSQQ